MVRPPRFHTKSLRRRSSGRKRWVQIVTIIVIIAASLAWMRWPITEEETQSVDMRFTLCGERGSQACVIDGDTVMIGRRKIRITGYNAPELKGDCAAEIALAIRSRAVLRDWLNQGAFTMSGGGDPPYDQYGRELRELKRDKEWLSEVMIAQGVAQEAGWGFQRGGWCG